MPKWLSKQRYNSAEVKQLFRQAANKIQEFKNPNINDKNIRFRKIDTAGFYSTIENALKRIKQDKGTPEQFKAMSLKNGAKQAELDWMG